LSQPVRVVKIGRLSEEENLPGAASRRSCHAIIGRLFEEGAVLELDGNGVADEVGPGE
jgi:hypothetical protein